jgi:PAS domain-containing protein
MRLIKKVVAFKKRLFKSKMTSYFRFPQKQASQYARSLIEASLDPLVTISAEGKITDVNEASEKVTGIPREKLIETAIFQKLLIIKSFKLSISRLFLMFVIVSFSDSIVRAQGVLLLNGSDGTYPTDCI